MINIGEHKDYTLKQKVVMLQGMRITGYGLKESIKLTEEDQFQLFDWFKENKPEFIEKYINRETERV